jgi:hypothetical protein
MLLFLCSKNDRVYLLRRNVRAIGLSSEGKQLDLCPGLTHSREFLEDNQLGYTPITNFHQFAGLPELTFAPKIDYLV